jgi:hypothetical protein
MARKRTQYRTTLCSTLAALVLAPLATSAQELEPRAYTNAPVGLNFFIIALANSDGGLATDPSIPLQDAKLKIHSSIFDYTRSLDLWGKSGKIDIILPFAQLSGTASLSGQPVERDVSGFGDSRVRISANLYGAPALTMAKFAGYKPGLVIGTSFMVSAPGAQYDPDKLVNIATNRWSFKPDIGFSKPFGAVTLDFTAGVTFYSDNDDFFGGKTREQDPVYSAQINLSYNIGKGMWTAVGTTYYRGGRTTVDGVSNDDELRNSRAGVILAVPLNRYHSIKFNVSSGISTRTGTDFDTAGIAWQYRWGAGL